MTQNRALATWHRIGDVMPRSLHRLYAGAMRYFWLPCPICGEMFGGHETEVTRGAYVPDHDGSTGKMVCRRCFTKTGVVR
jgi:hypothetical protein